MEEQYYMCSQNHPGPNSSTRVVPRVPFSKDGVSPMLYFQMYNQDIAQSQGKDFCPNIIFQGNDKGNKGAVKTATLMSNHYTFSSGIPSLIQTPLHYTIECFALLTKSEYKDNKGNEKFSILIKKSDLSNTDNISHALVKIGMLQAANEFFKSNNDFIKGGVKGIIPNNYLDSQGAYIKIELRTDKESGTFCDAGGNSQLTDTPYYTNFGLLDDNNQVTFITGPDSPVKTFDDIVDAYGGSRSGQFRITFRFPYIHNTAGTGSSNIGVKVYADCIIKVGSISKQYEVSPYLYN